jgi:hypothetical protein
LVRRPPHTHTHPTPLQPPRISHGRSEHYKHQSLRDCSDRCACLCVYMCGRTCVGVEWVCVCVSGGGDRWGKRCAPGFGLAVRGHLLEGDLAELLAPPPPRRTHARAGRALAAECKTQAAPAARSTAAASSLRFRTRRHGHILNSPAVMRWWLECDSLLCDSGGKRAPHLSPLQCASASFRVSPLRRSIVPPSVM